MIAGERLMVTGGAGFIGSHLVRELVRRGARQVVVLDSLRYGDVANLGALGDQVTLVRHTLGTDPPGALAEALRGVSGLFHLAAEKHNQSRDDPVRVLRANVEGTVTLLQEAARAGVRRVLFSSSLYAYGRLVGPPMVESERAEPRTVYGASKLAGEHLLGGAAREAGFFTTVLRYFFVYGPRQFAGMGYKSVILKSCERILRGQAPVVNGDGLQMLDYVYVDDVVEATLLAFGREGESGRTYNVGSGSGTRIRDLLQCLARVGGWQGALEMAPADWTHGTERVADTTLIQRELGWRARTGLEEGLAATWSWYQKAGAASRPAAD